jgi:hypothetical protein
MLWEYLVTFLHFITVFVLMKSWERWKPLYEKRKTERRNYEMTVPPKKLLDDIMLLDASFLFGSRSMAARSATESFDPSAAIGSRITEGTDWDFSAPWSQANHDALITNGFAHWPSDQLSYRDDLTVSVYIKSYSHKFDIKNLILQELGEIPTANVVLRNDFPLFVRTWNSIDPQFYHDYLWKRSPRFDYQDLSLTKSMIRDTMNQLFRTARQ